MPGFDFSIFESIIDMKVDEGFRKYFGSNISENNSIRKLILYFMSLQITRVIKNKLDDEISKKLQEHLNSLKTDPSFMS